MKKIIIGIIIIIAIFIVGLFFLPDKIDETDNTTTDIVCLALYEPICGTDDITYTNECELNKAKADLAYSGECDPSKIGYQNLNTASDFSLFCVAADQNTEYVINTEAQYQELASSISDHDNCQEYNLPNIDFSQHTLLGKYLTGTGCEVDFERNINKLSDSKKIIYTIEIKEEGYCEMLVSSMNWALIEKIPEDFSVEYHIKY